MRTAALVFCAAVSAMMSGCAGCSEECSGDNQGAETCPCGSDQDCSTRLGTVLLCVEGACAVADPPAADPELGRCNADGECAEGLGCGIEDICFVAPTCQRIDVALRFRIDEDTEGPITATRDDCEHSWSASAGAQSFEATLDIDLDGTVQADGCTTGHWFAADRVGELLCEGVTWAIAPEDVTTCVGAACPATCTLVGDSERVRVCP